MDIVADSIADRLREATHRLAEVSPTARLDAEILMAHLLGIDRSELLLRQRELSVPAGFADLIKRRLNSEPVAYIRGDQEFWGLGFQVAPDVLIPRADSETLIEMAVDFFAGRDGPARLLDLGTGSGALLIAALSEFGNSLGIGIDASAKALAIAAENAQRLGFSDRTTFHHRSWRDAGWADDLGQFDLILCNPPYVETGATLDRSVAAFEPSDALFAGENGLDDYLVLIPQVPRLLAPAAIAIFEIGSTQCASVTELAKSAGLSGQLGTDLGGNPRALRFSLGITSTGG